MKSFALLLEVGGGGDSEREVKERLEELNRNSCRKTRVHYYSVLHHAWLTFLF